MFVNEDAVTGVPGFFRIYYSALLEVEITTDYLLLVSHCPSSLSPGLGRDSYTFIASLYSSYLFYNTWQNKPRFSLSNSLEPSACCGVLQ